jgi:hypothetical protein
MDKEIQVTYYVTYDYNKFKLIDGNRTIQENNVIRLIKSFSICNLMKYHPVIVDRHYRILDGQHRVEFCRRQNVPVIYVIVDSDDEVDAMILLNVQTSWTMPDRVRHEAAAGSSCYMRVEKFAELSGLTVSAVLALINRAGSRGNSDVKLGEDIDVSLLDTLQLLIPYVNDLLFMLEELYIPDPKNKLIPLHKRISFREALFMFLKDKRINIDRFKSKLKQHLKHINLPDGKHAYLKSMRLIYNLGQRNDVLVF